jgi:hypothetical protein
VASGEAAPRILDRVAERLKPYGTTVDVVDGVGYVRG